MRIGVEKKRDESIEKGIRKATKLETGVL